MKSGYSKKSVQENIAFLLSQGASRPFAIRAALDHARAEYFKRHPNGMLPYHLRLPADKTRTNQHYRRNPVPPSKRVQIQEAAALYADFSGHEPEIVGTLDKPVIPDVLIGIGEVDGILYSTVRDGVLEKYVHKFAKKSRPLFAVSHDGKQLFMLGGAYNFTERGIVDKT